MGISCAAMSGRELDNRMPGPLSGRDEVVRAMSGLVERLAQLARNIERVAPAGAKPNGATINGPVAAVGEPKERMEVACPEPRTDLRQAENGVASHVLALHDRLGGFMKAPIPLLPADDENAQGAVLARKLAIESVSKP